MGCEIAPHCHRELIVEIMEAQCRRRNRQPPILTNPKAYLTAMPGRHTLTVDRMTHLCPWTATARPLAGHTARTILQLHPTVAGKSLSLLGEDLLLNQRRGRRVESRSPLTRLLDQLWADQRGQDVAEYAVMLAIILVIVVGTIRLIGSNANNVFSSVGSAIQ
jgi:Flp pilus assembly pilin Flp